MEKFSNTLREFKTLYFKKKILAIALLGYASGFPHILIFGAFTYWMREVGIDLKSIGLFALASTPFTLKFLWAPIIDGLKIPIICNIFGRRRGWILTLQITLIFLIVAIGQLSPENNLDLCIIFAVIISFC